MGVLIFVAIGLVFIFIVFSIIKKLIKFVVVGCILLMTLLLGGYFFLFGDGHISEEYLPEQAHENLQNIRNDARKKVEKKADEITDQAIKKVKTTTKDASKNIKKTVSEGVETTIDTLKKTTSDESTRRSQDREAKDKSTSD